MDSKGLGSLFELPYMDGRMIYLSPPRLSIMLPLKEGSYWTYATGTSSDSRIEKEVTGVELIKQSGKEYACFRVEWEYYNYLNVDVKITDWVAKEGLIKRLVKFDRINFVNMYGEYLYTGESTEVLQLTDFSLN